MQSYELQSSSDCFYCVSFLTGMCISQKPWVGHTCLTVAFGLPCSCVGWVRKRENLQDFDLYVQIPSKAASSLSRACCPLRHQWRHFYTLLIRLECSCVFIDLSSQCLWTAHTLLLFSFWDFYWNSVSKLSLFSAKQIYVVVPAQLHGKLLALHFHGAFLFLYFFWKGSGTGMIAGSMFFRIPLCSFSSPSTINEAAWRT